MRRKRVKNVSVRQKQATQFGNSFAQMNDLREKLPIFEISAQNFFVEPINPQLDVFERAKIRNDVQIEQRCHKTFRVEFADFGFASFVIAKFLKIRNLALVIQTSCLSLIFSRSTFSSSICSSFPFAS
jgi:hypothetical protein